MKRNDTIANLACSVLRHFGVEDVANETLPALDAALKQAPSNIVLLLLDGLGAQNLAEHLPPDAFLRRHVDSVYHSVFPPTTVAATTSVDTGLFPSQHGWLGWTMYFKPVDQNIVCFLNTDDEGKPFPVEQVAYRCCPYETVVQKLNRQGVKACKVSAYDGEIVRNLEEMEQKIVALCREPGRHYINCYYSEPDATMHRTGDRHRAVTEEIRKLDAWVEGLAGQLRDTLLIVTADHGHITCDGMSLETMSDLPALLRRPPSIEPRCFSLFAKDGMSEALGQYLHTHFAPDFRVYTHDEVLREELFGPGPMHPVAQDAIGDYLVVAERPKTLFNTTRQMLAMPGAHAGGMQKEKEIPLILIPCQGEHYV